MATRARAAFVTPSHRFPAGVAVSVARRLEVLAWARRNGAFIVEDDCTREFRYWGPPLASLQGLDNTEQVIYVGTLNKALFPGLRIGYAVVPRALLQAFVGARYLIDRQPATLQQAVVSEFMQQGHFAAHIRRMRQLYREQRDALAETLMRRATDRLTPLLRPAPNARVSSCARSAASIAQRSPAQASCWGLAGFRGSRSYRRPLGWRRSSPSVSDLKLLHGRSRRPVLPAGATASNADHYGDNTTDYYGVSALN